MKSCLATVVVWVGCVSPAYAQQQITTTAPLGNINSSYAEGGGFSWSLQGPNWFANFGGGGPLLPPFGPVDPNSGLAGGFAQNFGNGVSGSLGFNFYQGSNRSNVSTTPSITTLDGYPGVIQSGTVRTFVTGFTPIVGDYPVIPDPHQVHADAAQYAFDRARASEQRRYEKRLQKYLYRIETAEAEGDLRMARANYRNAIRIANEPLRSQLQQRLGALLARSRD